MEQAAAALEALNGYSLQEREIDVQIHKGRKKREPRKAPEGEDGRRSRRRRQPRRNDEDAPADGEAAEGRSRRRRPRRNKGEEGEDAPQERKEPEPVIVSNPDCHLFVGNLAWDVNGEDLQELFSKYGSVANASVTMNRKADRSRGWGTVEMSTAEEAAAALAGLHEFEYMERPLLVRADKRVAAE